MVEQIFLCLVIIVNPLALYYNYTALECEGIWHRYRRIQSFVFKGQLIRFPFQTNLHRYSTFFTVLDLFVKHIKRDCLIMPSWGWNGPFYPTYALNHVNQSENGGKGLEVNPSSTIHVQLPLSQEYTLDNLVINSTPKYTHPNTTTINRLLYLLSYSEQMQILRICLSFHVSCRSTVWTLAHRNFHLLLLRLPIRIYDFKIGGSPQIVFINYSQMFWPETIQDHK